MAEPPSLSLQIEMLEEEKAQLLYLAERHGRWTQQEPSADIRYLHRRIADSIKETINMFQDLVDALEWEASQRKKKES